MMTTPEKRKSPYSTIKSPTKKDIIAGYVIDVGPVSKGDYTPFFNLQFQTGEEVSMKMRGYNIRAHPVLMGFQTSGEKVKMEVRRSDNNNLTFGSYCQAYKASASEVLFPLNTSLKQRVLAGKVSRSITISELKTVNPTTNCESWGNG